MSKIKGVLFDLDGVILDTEGIYSRFWDKVEERFPTHIPNFSSVIKGTNLFEILHTYYSNEETRRLITEMLMEFQSTMPYVFFPGVQEFLASLNKLGIPACIVTSSDDEKMNAVYSQHPTFKNYFKAIVTGDMVTNSKPHPECFLLGAQKLGVEAKDCLIFEDSVKGLKAAQAAGGKVVALTTTNPRDVVAQYAHVILDSFVGLTFEQLVD
ncbi:MAG: HAD family phosphatase [Muribaculaceae bacterium]|nr:HAD family phosphatase [Muribaculaceae bacterium]